MDSMARGAFWTTAPNVQELHWLDIPERVNYKLGVLTHRCLLGKAPVYLSNCCIPVSQVASRRHLRSAARHQLTVPRHRLSTYGRRAFAVAGPTMFNNTYRPSDSRWRLIFCRYRLAVCSKRIICGTVKATIETVVQLRCSNYWLQKQTVCSRKVCLLGRRTHTLVKALVF